MGRASRGSSPVKQTAGAPNSSNYTAFFRSLASGSITLGELPAGVVYNGDPEWTNLLFEISGESRPPCTNCYNTDHSLYDSEQAFRSQFFLGTAPVLLGYISLAPTGAPNILARAAWSPARIWQHRLAAENTAATVAEDAVRFHHPFPKYLGGEVQQILEPLPKSLHDAFHSGLDKILPRQAGTAFYDSMTPAARSQMLQDLGAYTKAFDAKNGTQLFDAMVREGFPGTP